MGVRPSVLALTGTVLAIAVGVALYQGSSDSDVDSTGVAPAAFYAARFPDLNGHSQPLGQWQGKIVVLNFWATWCAPCREEIPLLMQIQQRFRDAGVQVVGLAIDESRQTSAYAREMAIDYPVLVDIDQGARFARRLGNPHGALPFTVIVDRGGQIVYRKRGLLRTRELTDKIRPLLSTSEKNGQQRPSTANSSR